MNKSESIQELSKSLVTANKEVKNPQKNAVNPHFRNKYATLDSVIEAYKESYLSNGISVLENPVTKEGMVGVEVTLLHESGQYITHDPFMLPPGKENAQGYGSSITYARRYALSAVMNIAADDDDDANNSSINQNNVPDSITQEQVGILKVKAMKLAKSKGRTTEELYKVMEIHDIEKLTKTQASTHIKQLDAWIANTKEGKNVPETKSQKTRS